jgi:hypothetical protein
MQVGEYEPEFPAGGRNWSVSAGSPGWPNSASNVELWSSSIPNPRAPGFAFRFHSDQAGSDRRPDGFLVELWVGTDSAAVAGFLSGFQYGKVLGKRLGPSR